VREKGAVGQSAERQKRVELQQRLQDAESGGAAADNDPRNGQRPSDSVHGRVDCVLEWEILTTRNVKDPGAEH